MWKILLATAGVAYGDYCFNSQNISIRIALQGSKLNISAATPAAWVGIGVPKSEDYDEMARGNFVMGSGSQVYEYKLDMDYNGKPNQPINHVDGTGQVSVVGGFTTLRFLRNLTGEGLNPINPSRPFNLLWAYGYLKPGATDYAALDYHHKARDHFRVDLSNNNCGTCASVICADDTWCVNGTCVDNGDDDDDDDDEDQPTLCTMDAKTCPDGSSVGRVPPNCEFAPCPPVYAAAGGPSRAGKKGKLKGKQGKQGKSTAAMSQMTPRREADSTICTADARQCPDGSYVGRVGPDCQFAPCPGATRRQAPGVRKGGKKGKRNGDASSCAAILCPVETRCVNGRCIPLGQQAGTVCPLDVRTCPDGSYVGRVPPNCEFEPCPDQGTLCTLDAKLCPDGSYVGRVPPDCQFAPCPGG